jgi:hypothetical protein
VIRSQIPQERGAVAHGVDEGFIGVYRPKLLDDVLA